MCGRRGRKNAYNNMPPAPYGPAYPPYGPGPNMQVPVPFGAGGYPVMGYGGPPFRGGFGFGRRRGCGPFGCMFRGGMREQYDYRHSQGAGMGAGMGMGTAAGYGSGDPVYANDRIAAYEYHDGPESFKTAASQNDGHGNDYQREPMNDKDREKAKYGFDENKPWGGSQSDRYSTASQEPPSYDEATASDMTVKSGKETR